MSEPLCAVCGRKCKPGGPGAWEEGTDDFWCIACMSDWEIENKEDWATGQPWVEKVLHNPDI